MRIFDTHAHYDSEQFKEDMDTVLKQIHNEEGCSTSKDLAGSSEENDALKAGQNDKDIAVTGVGAGSRVPVQRIINVGADMESSYSTVELAHHYDFIYAAVGVHPDSAGELVWCPEKGSSKDSIEDNRKKLKALAMEKKVAAIGEIGLDYHWDVWPREVQKEAFIWQWKLAIELDYPVIIHSRDAAEDTMKIVREFYRIGSADGPKPLNAVMHCYSYSPEQADEYLKMGLMIGVGGVVTFKNAKKLKEVVDLVPLDRILLETDCPYMAPEPFRGKRNNSGYLCYVAEKIAEIKGIEVGKVYSTTWENAERFFKMA